MILRYATVSFLCSFFLLNTLFAGATIAPRLAAQLQHLAPGDEILAWVLFTDKGELQKSAVPKNVVSERSFLRRLKSRPADSAVDYTDLPVQRRYVDQIAERVVQLREVSKWFNGVSVRATRSQLEEIAQRSFVSSLETLTRMKRDPSRRKLPTDELPIRNSQFEIRSSSSIDYGLSFPQLNMINVPAVHNTGNYGQGVVIGVMDNGFRLMNHECFDTLRPRIIATYDFVDKKVSVVPNNPSPGFGFHGMYILSAIAGYKAGEVIGPAFGSSFVLARTENDSSETPFEEDKWVAAVEWMDSIGVDITTTSLGYLGYDPPYPSWTWEQMNGNTTVITRAADLAVSKGIVVVNSAGNNGLNTEHNTLNAPADGDSVLSIGAANPDGSRAGFSSVGPTTSIPARMKPDLMAQGSTVRCASELDPHGYIYQQGTSLSCPLAAGVAALVLHANPNLNPIQVANALKRTASNSGSPNNLIGWGIINALSATTSVGPLAGTPEAFRLIGSYPNPFNPSTNMTFEYSLPRPARVTLRIFNMLGQEVRTLVDVEQAASVPTVQWNATKNDGRELPSGVYFARLSATPLNGEATYRETHKIVLLK